MRLYLIALLFYIAGLCAALAYDLARHAPRSKVITYRRRYTPSRWEAARLGLGILFSSARYGLSL